MRQVKNHHVGMMKDMINIVAGEKGPGGASMNYSIHHVVSNYDYVSRGLSDPDVKTLDIFFQSGNPAEEVNGITNEALLSVVLDRLEGFQSGEFKCRETAIAITKIEEALLWIGKRSQDRYDRKVEGKLEK